MTGANLKVPHLYRRGKFEDGNVHALNLPWTACGKRLTAFRMGVLTVEPITCRQCLLAINRGNGSKAKPATRDELIAALVSLVGRIDSVAELPYRFDADELQRARDALAKARQ